ncbi:MAG TPA: hypothetical protein V6D37_10525 [Candidatus Sericytochromatia bacterium]
MQEDSLKECDRSYFIVSHSRRSQTIIWGYTKLSSAAPDDSEDGLYT